MALRTGFGVTMLLAGVTLYLAFRIPNRSGNLIGMASTLSLFAMPLAGLWASGQTQSTVLSGLIPLNDAQLYYTDALRLMDGTAFSTFSARRPIFAGLFAVLLSITGRNLMAALAILTAITGLACYFTVREIQRTHGAEVAAFILLVLFLFNRAHSGISMSESLGLALGSLGFGLLWRGASTKSLLYIWTGLLATTLALNARAGAFFVLPILILWTGWLLRENKLIPWKVLFISASAVVLGFVLNLALTRLLAVPNGVPFANFSYTLYGLASGGKSWAYVFQANPELLGIPEPEQSKRIYQLAFDLMRTNPMQTVQGALFNWKMLFSDSWYNIYTYIGGENWKINNILVWSMYILCIIGIFAWTRNRKDPIQSLVMACSIGVFISVPFLPPTDAYRMRPYAASIVIFGALPALGLTYLISKIKFLHRADHIPDENLEASSKSLFAYSLILVLITVFGPILIRSIARPHPIQLASCVSGSTAIAVRFDKGTFINLKRQSDSFLDWMPNYHISLFWKNAHSLPDGNMINWAGSIEPTNTVFLTLDYLLHQDVMIVVPTKLLPKPGTFIQMCGQYQTDYVIKTFYVDEIKIMPQ